MKWQDVSNNFGETAKVTGMIFVLFIGAMIFSSFMSLTEIPLELANFLENLALPTIVILGALLLVYILIGLVTEIVAVIMLMAPILHTVLVGLGFALAGIARDVPLFTIFRGSPPLSRSNVGWLNSYGSFPVDIVIPA